MKTALITGASSGIGLELAKLFAKDGWHLVLVAREKKDLQKSANSLEKEFGARNTIVISKDLGKPNSAKEIYALLQKRKIAVDALVNNAGFATYGEFAKVPLEKQLAMLQVNINSLVALTGFFLPQMLGRKNGRVLNLASTAAFQPGPLMAAYYASKSFVLSFSEALAEELDSSKSGVTVTALCPGPTWTGFQKRAGMLNSKVLGGNVMDAREVAQYGYNAFLRGERVAIPGLKNKLGSKLVKIIPAKLLTKIIRKIQEERKGN